MKLTEKQILHAKPGMHADENGLYLQVSPAGTKSWIYRFSLDGRRREMGLGGLADVPAKQARADVLACKQQVLDQIDPIEARRRGDDERAAAAAKAAGKSTVRQVAQAHIAVHAAGWRNAKHAQQWANTLETYAYPVLGDVSVDEVTDDMVLAVLTPIWNTRTETATRVRSRIETVLDAGAVRLKIRGFVNPARWKGHLEHMLAAPRKVRPVVHHPALPYAQMPAFMAQLRGHSGVSALALELLILTAVRSGEVLQAEWSEFDREGAMWTVPAERTKTNREHRVALSPPAVAVLERAAALKQHDYVFPGVQSGRPMSDMALTMLLRGMRPGLTVHGFRSTFRDWVAERTTYANELAEMALGHAVGDKVEAAYRRGDMVDRRRQLMVDWADYCDVP